MGTHRATLTAGSLIAFGLSMAAAASTWTLYSSYVAFDKPVTSIVTIANTIATVNAIVSIAFTWRRYSNQRRANRHAIDELCVQAIRLHRIIERRNQLHCNPGYEYVPGDTYDATVYGRLIGIRMAICVLNDWVVDDHADKEGPADELVQAYWEKNFPADWASRL